MEQDRREQAILDMIRAMNRCWTAGWHEEKFREYIHAEAVAIVPSVPGRLCGREAYVAGWRSFCEAAVIHEWRETDHLVQVYAGGKAAVVTYLFAISFVMAGQRQILCGRDMLFLVREGRRWLVAADQFSPEPAPG